MTSHQIRGSGRASLLSIMSDPFICISFSQYGEDTLIAEYLSGKFFVQRSKFFVDIGAYHPSRFSNTKLLSMLGWTGINVDPNPDSISLFEKARPLDKNLNLGVSLMEGVSTLYRFSEGAFNTFDPLTAEKYIKEGCQFIGEHKVDSMTINDLLEKYLPADVKDVGIGFLDIDCEGLDSEIIDMLDIPRFNPLIIAAESHGFDPLCPLESRICKKILPHGYVLAAYAGPTLLFWKKNPDL
jgi:hypothetical protein